MSNSLNGKRLLSVALRKESVDRNPIVPLWNINRQRSLSARRAWIEIVESVVAATRQIVALRKESVDRNSLVDSRFVPTLPSLSARRAWIEINPANGPLPLQAGSLSARRAWIEIGCTVCGEWRTGVALRKESVDRNPALGPGENQISWSLSARRAWIEM